MSPSQPNEPDEEVVDIPLDGVLDLHHFRPRDVRDVVTDYLDACRNAGVLEVRLIHGKGKGVQRASVRALLEARNDVLWFRDAPPSRGAWGATILSLRPAEPMGR